MLTFAHAKRPATRNAGKRHQAPPRRTPGIGQVLNASHIQPKLKIGAVNDPAEAEADRVADRIMRMPEPQDSVSATDQGRHVIRRLCAECEDEVQTKADETVRRMEEDEEVMTKAGPGGPDSGGAEAAAAAVRNGGAPLPHALRSFFEPRFGRDFSNVRLHRGSAAEEAASSINARAYTLGQNIAFGPGQFAPGSPRGKELIAHELTHTVQQSKPVSNSAEKGPKIVRPKDASGTVIQRDCGHDEDFYQTSSNFCRDDTWSPITHSGKVCYREITTPTASEECPPGEHVCFDESGECETSPDRSSLADTKEADGSCTWRNYCVLEHIAVDVVPAVLSDYFESLGRQQVECIEQCRRAPWYLRGFCLQSCSPTMHMY